MKTNKVISWYGWLPDQPDYYARSYDYLANHNLSDDFWTIRAFENPGE